MRPTILTTSHAVPGRGRVFLETKWNPKIHSGKDDTLVKQSRRDNTFRRRYDTVGKYVRAIRRIASRHRRTAAYSGVVAIYSCLSSSRGMRAWLRLVIPYCTEAATVRYAAGCRATRAGCRYVGVKAGSHQLCRICRTNICRTVGHALHVCCM